jgi:hypothetical protein
MKTDVERAGEFYQSFGTERERVVVATGKDQLFVAGCSLLKLARLVDPRSSRINCSPNKSFIYILFDIKLLRQNNEYK